MAVDTGRFSIDNGSSDGKILLAPAWNMKRASRRMSEFDIPIARPTPLWRSSRLSLAIVAFWGFVNLYAQRINMSVALLCMVNHTAVSELSDARLNISVAEGFYLNTSVPNTDSVCPNEVNGANVLRDGRFAWPKEIQGIILGSFFWGYLLTQVPGGWLAGRFGTKRVFGFCMALCALCTLLMPMAAEAHYGFLIFLRFLAGALEGVSYPSMQAMWAKWAPPLERSKLCGFTYAGTQIGNVITLPLAALLCEYGFSGGWPSIFYLLGVLGLVWFIFWMFLVYDSPEDHPRISEDEKRYIITSVKGIDRQKKVVAIPWLKILKSPAILSLVFTAFCANWGIYTFLTNLPTFMREILKFDIKSNGGLSALPYLFFWFFMNLSGFLADHLRVRRTISTTQARKIFNTIGMVGPAILVIATGFMDCTRPAAAVILLTLGVSLSGCCYGAGWLVNAVDISPRHAGVISGITNTMASVPGFVAPVVIGVVTRDQTQQQWQIVFYITAGIYVVGAVVYCFFASGELQTWAADDFEVDVDEEGFIKYKNPRMSLGGDDIIIGVGRINRGSMELVRLKEECLAAYASSQEKELDVVPEHDEDNDDDKDKD